MANFTPPGCGTDKLKQCSDLETCELENLGNVDAANIQQGDTLCYINGVWTNTPKIDLDNQLASDVPIADAGAFYVGSDVESALQEIGVDCDVKQTAIDANANDITTLQSAAHIDDDVETVAGTAVDNTDPRNPVIDTPDAAEISVADMNNYYTSADVEDVLQELGADCTAKQVMLNTHDVNINTLLNDSHVDDDVETVSGTAVDNSDARNPVINYPEAINISVTDMGGYYISSDVEDILQEVGSDCAAKQVAIDANAMNIANLQGSSHPDDDVETVTGSAVDNTDPRNPVINYQTAADTLITDSGDYYTSSDTEGALQEIGMDCVAKQAAITNITNDIVALQGSSHPDDDVETVTGSAVDNTDPRNPVINMPDAIDVSLADMTNYYASSDLEGALQEIGADCAAKEARLTALESQTDNAITSLVFNAATGELTAVDLDGNSFTSDLSAAFDNINAIPGSYSFTDNMQSLTVPLSNGANVVIDASDMASENELNNAIAVAISTLAAEDYLLKPSLTGTVITFPLNQGAFYTLDLTSLNESVTDNGDGTFTFDDGEGGTPITWTGDTDDQAITSSDGSVTITPTTQSNGQVDYDVTNPNPLIDPGSSPYRMSAEGGSQSYGANTTGTHGSSDELKIGAGAGNNATGEGNTYVGKNAGSGVTAHRVSCFGRGAGLDASGQFGTYIGENAGSGSSAGFQVAVGFSSLRGSTGASSVGVGDYALINNTGASATGVGYRALRNNTGSQATGLGRDAGIDNTFNNVGLFGSEALATQDNMIKLGNPVTNLVVTDGDLLANGILTASDPLLKKNWVPQNLIEGALRYGTFEYDEEKVKITDAYESTYIVPALYEQVADFEEIQVKSETVKGPVIETVAVQTGVSDGSLITSEYTKVIQHPATYLVPKKSLGKTHFGVMADDPALPREAVTVDSMGYKHVDYLKLATRENARQDMEIAALKADMAELRSMVESRSKDGTKSKPKADLNR
ncbi:MAG: hypothetical protein ACPGVT_07940 [Maricaulaceae bacterium]